MQERVRLTPRQINHDLLHFVMVTPLWFWVVAAVLGLVVGIAGIVVILLVGYGLGFLGLDHPVFWAFLITNFVFWVGISHAGVMISAILRLTQAEWRRPVTRAAEVLTLFALATAALMPLLHTGRQWRALYWIFPYDIFRGIWPDVRSALIWDPSAIFTYLTSSSLFVYVALVPDLAVARDHSTGWRRSLYAVLCLGFYGSKRQWKLQALAGILLSALILPIFVSVHTIVSWDFASAIVPAWHSTIFAPYFVIGAVHSGVSAVVTVMVILRRALHLEKYITPDHFDALGRLLIAVATTWFFFFFVDYVFAAYSQEPSELAVMNARTFVWPFNLLSIIFLLSAYFIPVPLWLFRGVRRSAKLMLITTLLVNVGMWLERFLIIVPGLLYKSDDPFMWGSYTPTLSEYAIVIGSIAFVSLGLLVFAKLFPIIPIYDMKEGQTLQEEIAVGRREVPAIIKD